MNNIEDIIEQIEDLLEEIKATVSKPKARGIKVTNPHEFLRESGIDPNKAWSDDPGLTRKQRNALRSVGRNASLRKWRESENSNPSNHGM